jgi:amidohydrolase
MEVATNPNFFLHPMVVEYSKDLITLRRTIHKFPEILYDLPITRKVILEYLSQIDIEVFPKVGESGIVALIRGEGPCILLRADMDALNITETLNTEYKSQITGKMHACGHDGHIAMLLVAAKILSNCKSSLKGSVKFVFQPAEEGGHGSKAMIDDEANPVLVNPEVSKVFGIHITNAVPLGSFIASYKYASSNSDYFKIDVIGKGGHASAPYLTKDPIIAGSQLVMALQTIISRNIDPQIQAVLSVTMINSGEVFNAIPDTYTICGTIRTFEPEIKNLIENRIIELCQGIEKMFNCKVDCTFTHYYNPIVNDSGCVEEAARCFKKVSPNAEHGTIAPMIGEDFYYFTDEKPGCFLMLGTGTENKNFSLHSPNFDFEEQAMLIGCSYWVELVQDLLK